MAYLSKNGLSLVLSSFLSRCDGHLAIFSPNVALFVQKRGLQSVNAHPFVFCRQAAFTCGGFSSHQCKLSSDQVPHGAVVFDDKSGYSGIQL
jgi:hypothetical protein